MSTVYGQLLWNVHPATESKLDYSTFVTHPFSFYHTPIIAKSRFWNLEQIAFPNRQLFFSRQKFLLDFHFFFLLLFSPFFFFSLSLSLFSNDYWRVIAGERNRRTLTSIFENLDLDPPPPPLFSLKAKQSYFLDDCIIISLHFRRDIFRIIFKRDKSIIKIQSMEKRGVQRRIQDLVQDGNTKIYI